MINIPITKILFLDIETVGGCPDYESCQKFSPDIAEQFEKYFDWFLKRFPEDTLPSLSYTTEEHMDFVFKKRAALVPEFAKIVCVSMAFVMENGDVKKQTFSDNDEKTLLDLVCSTMGIPTPKDGEVTGDKVHETYWGEQKLKEISEYCEKDVDVLIEFIKKLKNLK